VTYNTLISVACVVAWLFIVLPCALYLLANAGWRERRQRILTYFKPSALELYFTLYFPSVDISKDSGADLINRFEKHYGCYYGRRHYITPFILLGTISGLGLFVVSESLKNWYGDTASHFAVSPIVVSSFLGAFTWVASDQIARFRRRDCSSSDVYRGSFRMLIAVPFGYSLAAFANKDFGVAVGFLIGVFPTETLFKIGRRLAGQKLGLGDDVNSAASELEILQNIGKTNAERFYDEGVTTIAELAWIDPVDLAVRTNFDFNYVVDCMGQALLAVYVGDDIRKLSRFSLRAAQEAAAMIYEVGEDIESANPTPKQTYARQALTQAAAALNLDPKTFYYTLTSVAEDPYTTFIWQMVPQEN
jgi:hypothetical protein